MEKIERKIALFIDAQNVSAKYMDSVMNELPKYGTLVLSRLYGDQETINRADWVQIATKYAYKPMQQYAVAMKKNAADMAMAIDALEIMYQDKAEIFILVTSDSDFTPLAIKLRENGMFVVGIGKEKQVTSAFKASCNEVKYFEYLVEEESSAPAKQKEVIKSLSEIEATIKEIIVEDGPDNSMYLSMLGDTLIKRNSDFDPRKYGAKSLSDLIKSLSSVRLIKDKHNVMLAELVGSTTRKQVEEELMKILSKTQGDSDLNKVKVELEKALPAFDYRTFGFTRFSVFVASFQGVAVNGNKAKLKEEQPASAV
jgi:uncharacterized protein (TIGR00288 family)